MFGFGSRVFSAIQRANRIDRAIGFAFVIELQERADGRQLATCSAGNAFAFAVLGDGQKRGNGSLRFCAPCIFVLFSHNRESPRTTVRERLWRDSSGMSRKLAHSTGHCNGIWREAHFEENSCKVYAELCIPEFAPPDDFVVFEGDMKVA